MTRNSSSARRSTLILRRRLKKVKLCQTNWLWWTPKKDHVPGSLKAQTFRWKENVKAVITIRSFSSLANAREFLTVPRNANSETNLHIPRGATSRLQMMKPCRIWWNQKLLLMANVDSETSVTPASWTAAFSVWAIQWNLESTSWTTST